MLNTRLTRKYGLRRPFVSAGMSTATTPALIAAVCNAGGLGLHGAADMPIDQLRADIEEIRSLTKGVFGITLIPRLCNDDHVRVCAEARVPLVNFFWDDIKDEWLSSLRKAGVHVWKQVCSIAEAKHCLDLGLDAVMVQGSEAGGHNRAEGSTLSMVPAVADIAGDTPIIASGGIADARAAAAALALGADAVCVGTRLLASHEAYAHDEYKRRLIAAGVGDSVRTNIFGLQWKDATTRHLRNRIVAEWEHRDYPAPYKALPDAEHPEIGKINIFGTEYSHQKFSMYPPNPSFTGDLEQACLYGGESVGQTKSLMGAGEIVAEIMDGAESIIRDRLAGMLSQAVEPARSKVG